MSEIVHLFGRVNGASESQVESGAFRFALASVELNGKSWITLADILAASSNNPVFTDSPNAPWFRGCLQTLFAFQQSPNNLDCES
jgi:hypothetical protein